MEVSVRLCSRDSHSSCNCFLFSGKHRTWKSSPAPRLGNGEEPAAAATAEQPLPGLPVPAPARLSAGTPFNSHDPSRVHFVTPT